MVYNLSFTIPVNLCFPLSKSNHKIISTRVKVFLTCGLYRFVIFFRWRVFRVSERRLDTKMITFFYNQFHITEPDTHTRTYTPSLSLCPKEKKPDPLIFETFGGKKVSFYCSTGGNRDWSIIV